MYLIKKKKNLKIGLLGLGAQHVAHGHLDVRELAVEEFVLGIPLRRWVKGQGGGSGWCP